MPQLPCNSQCLLIETNGILEFSLSYLQSPDLLQDRDLSERIANLTAQTQGSFQGLQSVGITTLALNPAEIEERAQLVRTIGDLLGDVERLLEELGGTRIVFASFLNQSELPQDEPPAVFIL